MSKIKKTKTSKSKVMAYDLFERKYRKDIEVMTEKILDNTLKDLSPNKQLKDDEYDNYYDDAFEEAVHVLAFEKGYKLE